MSKYQPLSDFLTKTASHVQEIVLSFDQVAQIISSNLPHSAHVHRQWWENQVNTSNRAQAKAWDDAGFQVADVDQNTGWVKFTRQP